MGVIDTVKQVTRDSLFADERYSARHKRFLLSIRQGCVSSIRCVPRPSSKASRLKAGLITERLGAAAKYRTGLGSPHKGLGRSR